jgi:hypothetical protein
MRRRTQGTVDPEQQERQARRETAIVDGPSKDGPTARRTTPAAKLLQAFKKASLLVLAERDLRSREAVQVKRDLSAIYEVLEGNRRDRASLLALLVR